MTDLFTPLGHDDAIGAEPYEQPSDEIAADLPSESIAEQPHGSLSNARKALQVLKDWKELIGIVVFFGTGVLWVVGYFATKKGLDQVQCLMESNLQSIQAQMTFNDMTNEMKRVHAEMTALDNRQKMPQGSLTSIESQMLYDLGIQYNDLQSRRALAQKKLDHISDDFHQGKCFSK